MSNPVLDTAQWVRDQFDSGAERVFKLGTLIATWLIVGNAAALVVCFNAVTVGRVCDFPAFGPVIWSFVLGLGTAFIGVTINYFGGLFGVQTLGAMANATTTLAINEYYIEKLEAEGIVVADDAPLNMGITEAGATIEKLKRRLWRHWALLLTSVLFFLASAAFFARGVLLPLSPSVTVAMCASLQEEMAD